MKKPKFLIIFLLMVVAVFTVKVYAEENNLDNNEHEEVDLLPNVEKGVNNSLILSWENAEGVKEFQIFRSTKATSGFKKIKSIKTNTYTDTKLTYGTTYYYKVTAVFESKTVSSEVVSAKVLPDKVTNVKVTAGVGNSKVTYNKTNNSGYEVYFSADNVKWTKATTITKSKTTNYTKKSLKANTTYYFKVRAYQKVKSKKVYGEFSEVVSVLTAPSTPTLSLKGTSYNEITLNINNVSGAEYYEVQRSTNSKKGFVTIGNTTPLTYGDDGIVPTTTYYYKVRACNSNMLCGSYSKVYSAKTIVAVPRLNGTAYVSSANLNWTEVGYANGYELSYSTYKNKKFSVLSNEKVLEFNKENLIPGKTYYFRVRAFVIKNGKKYYSGYSNILTLKPSIKQVTGLSLEPGLKMVKASWSNMNGVDGFEVYRSTSKNGKYTLANNTDHNSCDDMSLKDKTTYYYKVRAFKKVGNTKYYGSYSAVVSAKTLDGAAIDYTNVMNHTNENLEFVSSRLDLRNELYMNGFSDAEINYGVNNANIDWQERANDLAALLQEENLSKEEIKRRLIENEFTETEANNAVNNMEVDWNEVAASRAYNEHYSFSEEGLRRYLLGCGFTEDETNYAIEHVRGRVDYSETAADTALELAESDNYSLQEIKDELDNRFFTEEEIEAATSSLEIDFVEVAVRRAIEMPASTKENTKEYLLSNKFTEEQAEAAANQLYVNVTSTLETINLNDPIYVWSGSGGSGCYEYTVFKNPSDINKISPAFVNGRKIYAWDERFDWRILDDIERDITRINQIVNSIKALAMPAGMAYKSADAHDGGYFFNDSRLIIANPSYLGDFGRNFQTLYAEYDESVNNLTKDSYILAGGCGSGPEPAVRLTKAMCTEYHLNCVE